MNLDRIGIIKFLDKIILSSLYAIAFFLPISKAIIESFSILAITCFIVKKILQRKSLPSTHLNKAIFVYLIICFFSIFISTNLKISARTFFSKLMQNAMFFFVLVDTLNTERRFKTIIYILFLSSLLLGIDGIYQHFTCKDFIRHRPYYDLPRIHATFPTPNDFGCYIYSIMPFTLVYFFTKFKLKLSRFLFLALFLLLFTCLILTISRGAWFAFLASILFMSMWIHHLGIFLLVLGIFIIATQQFYGPYLKERLRNFFVFLDTSSIDRRIIWQTAWKMFVFRPLIGVGLGTFMFNFKKFVIAGYPHGASYAHNCYLQIASETGILGLISFLFIITLFFYHGIKALNSQAKTFFWYVLLASLAAMLGYALQMTVDTTFYSLDLGMLFWILLGLGIAAMRSMIRIS